MTRRTRSAALIAVLALLLSTGRAFADPIFAIDGVYSIIDPAAHSDPNPPVTFTLKGGTITSDPFKGSPVSDLQFRLNPAQRLELLTFPRDLVIDPGSPEAIFHLRSEPQLVFLRDPNNPAILLDHFIIFPFVVLDSAFNANPDLSAFRDNRVVFLLRLEGVDFTPQGGITWDEAVRDVRAPFSLVVIPEPGALAVWGLAGLVGGRVCRRGQRRGACQKRITC